MQFSKFLAQIQPMRPPVPETTVAVFLPLAQGRELLRQPVFRFVFQASMALCSSIRRRVWGAGGLGVIQL